MKTSELRIGNWITNEIDKEVFQCAISDLMNMVNGWRSYKPIPLTEEWLLGFGFIWNDETKTYENLNKCFSTWHVLKGININAQNWEVVAWVTQSVLNRKIKHVHQLQNLYFALTGEELNTLKDE